MQKEQVDQDLSFKKRARRRLVGAIALVLLMVIVLPMLLEDREKTVQEDVEIIMPTQSSDLEASSPVAIEDTGDFEELVIEEPTTQSASKSETVDLPKPDKPTEDSEPKKTAKVETQKPAEAKKEPEKASNENNKYYVQIGVFSNTNNIKKLQVKLNELGYKSLTEKITTDSGVKTRLRTESFVGRNEAAIALENIKDAGLAGMVVSQK